MFRYFTQQSNVAGCRLMITSSKPFSCSLLCTSPIESRSTDASPHGCDVCSERFKDPSMRHEHVLRIHGSRRTRNSDLRSLLKDNLFMNLSSDRKWRLPDHSLPFVCGATHGRRPSDKGSTVWDRALRGRALIVQGSCRLEWSSGHEAAAP